MGVITMTSGTKKLAIQSVANNLSILYFTFLGMI